MILNEIGIKWSISGTGVVIEQSITPGQTINKRKTCILNLFTDYNNGNEDLLMLLSELLNKIKAVQVIGNPPGREVTGVEYDSRKVVDGSVFVAIKGFNTDGHFFIQDALNKKAVAIVVENSECNS